MLVRVSSVVTVTTVIEPTARATTLSKIATTEWLTAIGTMFAAVGTVSAVAVALWQTSRSTRRDRRSVQMRMAAVVAIASRGAATPRDGKDHQRVVPSRPARLPAIPGS